MEDALSEDSMRLYDLRVSVHEIRGRSVCGMSVGDTGHRPVGDTG